MTSTEDTTTGNDIPLYPHQRDAAGRMKNGCILCGGVGTGKSRTALYYYWDRVLGRKPLGPPLVIITTARKRDTHEWEDEMEPFPLIFEGITVDSWNNIKKYEELSGCFFIFDEQRVVGYGAWVKAFLRITKRNEWILLTATPGDTWQDYIPVFIANGFYRNKTDFTRQHAVWSRRTKYPKIERYVATGRLIRYRNDILVNMEYRKQTVPHYEVVYVDYNRDLMKDTIRSRWDIYKNEPIRDAGALCYIMRKIVNSDPMRIWAVKEILREHEKAIIFYNFDYELEMLRLMAKDMDIPFAEWNGHRHEPIPEGEKWAYLVQYTAGAEGWNCTTTDTVIFYSQNYSYKITAQSAGRIDRMNTPYQDLFYYQLCSRSGIDLAIRKAINAKKNFNESMFAERVSA